MALTYWTPFVTPDDFADTTEGLQAYQDAIAPYVVGPAYEDYMQVPGPAGLQELNGGFGLTKAQLAQQWGGYGDGRGPLDASGTPTDLTRIGAALTEHNNGFNYYSRAKVRPQEAVQAYFLLNPDGTPVLPDHILKYIEVALDEVLGPDWFEQAWEEVRQGIIPAPEQQMGNDSQPGVAAMPDADERTPWGVPKGFYDGTFEQAMILDDARARGDSRRERWGNREPFDPRDTPENRARRDQAVQRALEMMPPPAPAPVVEPPPAPAPQATAPPPAPAAPPAPEPQISGPGSSGATPPQDSPQSDWGFDPVTGLYCNNVTGECV